MSFFSDIALVLIDEVHLLNDPRGAALEAIVSRIKMLAHNPEMKSSPLSCVRFLAVSATIPNIEDLGKSNTVLLLFVKELKISSISIYLQTLRTKQMFIYLTTYL